MTARTCSLLLAGCLLVTAVTGCGGPNLAKVTGRVTVGGKPVKSGMVMFHPEAGPSAVGTIESDGTYRLTTIKPGDGAVVGSHRVAIQSTEVGAGSMEEPKNIEEELSQSRYKGKILVPGKVTWVVPEKYSRPETAGLTAKVEDKKNEINFDIPAR